MPNYTPQTITKAVLKETHDLGKDAEYAIKKMCDVWKDAFPIIHYIDDAEFISAKRKREGSFKKTSNANADLGLGFDEVWGDDLNDVNSFIGVAVEATKPKDKIEILEHDLNGHLTEGLTRTQLERTGFVNHGGFVITFLKPMLKHYGVVMNKGSHIVWRSQKYEVAEMVEIVKWADIKDNLYVVCNCI